MRHERFQSFVCRYIVIPCSVALGFLPPPHYAKFIQQVSDSQFYRVELLALLRWWMVDGGCDKIIINRQPPRVGAKDDYGEDDDNKIKEAADGGGGGGGGV